MNIKKLLILVLMVSIIFSVAVVSAADNETSDLPHRACGSGGGRRRLPVGMRSLPRRGGRRVRRRRGCHCDRPGRVPHQNRADRVRIRRRQNLHGAFPRARGRPHRRAGRRELRRVLPERRYRLDVCGRRGDRHDDGRHQGNARRPAPDDPVQGGLPGPLHRRQASG